MSAYTNGSTLGTVVKWLIVGFLALIALKVGFFILGAAVALSVTLLFTFGPLALIGWAVLKFFRMMTRPSPGTI